MVNPSHVEEQLKRVGCNYRFWGYWEVRELRNILMPDEVIAQAVNGYYENGFAMLCVTDQRVLLVDKKPLFLSLEDIRYDMVTEIDFSSQLIEGTMRVVTPTRTLAFTSWSQRRLRNALNYMQQRLSDIRSHYIQQQFLPARNDAYAAPAAGGLALQGNATVQQNMAPFRPNLYTQTPLTLRRHRVPKFY